MKLQRVILFLTVFVTSCFVFAQESLSPKEQEEILKVLCDGEVLTKGELICKGEPDDAWFSELRWETAMKGHWVANEDQWLITLHGFCHGGCLGRTFIVTKKAKQWIKIGETDGRVHMECVRLQRSVDGLDRMVCPGVWGAQQGFVTEWVEVFSFNDNKFSSRKLLYKEQGGECYNAHPPAKAEYQADILSELSAGAADSEIAFTMHLQVRRLENCDSTIEEPDKLAKMKGEYLLKFLKREKEIVPDERTEKVLKATGWMDLPE